MNKKERIKNRFLHLEKYIKDLFDVFIYESFTDSKNMISDDITKKLKSLNLFSYFGGKYKTYISINPLDNLIKIDVWTLNNKWRLIKYEFYA